MTKLGALVAAVALATAAVTTLTVDALATGEQTRRPRVATPDIPAPATNLDKDGNPMPAFSIGFVQLAEDSRYNDDYAYNLIPVRPFGRPYAGAQVGLLDAAPIGKAIGLNFTLEQKIVADAAEAAQAVDAWVAAGTHFVIADLPAAALLAVATATAGKPLILLNVAAQEDSLRGADCRANVVHIIPSTMMEVDSLVQYVVSKKWRRILALQGPLPDDALVIEALQRSAKYFGATVVDVKPFVLSNDPRNREETNVALITAGERYDVVFVADTDGEFSRFVPYETNDPRPVIGASGLSALAWHWAWERQGAPQVNARFEAAANRRMAGVDWAAFVAVKAIVQSVLRSKSTEFDAVRGYLLGDQMNLDGTKGNPMSVRPWDHQLRQPMLLATSNAVLERAPIEGFLHQTNELDTLGVDQPNTACSF